MPAGNGASKPGNKNGAENCTETCVVRVVTVVALPDDPEACKNSDDLAKRAGHLDRAVSNDNGDCTLGRQEL